MYQPWLTHETHDLVHEIRITLQKDEIKKHCNKGSKKITKQTRGNISNM